MKTSGMCEDRGDDDGTMVEDDGEVMRRSENCEEKKDVGKFNENMRGRKKNFRDLYSKIIFFVCNEKTIYFQKKKEYFRKQAKENDGKETFAGKGSKLKNKGTRRS